MFMQDFFYDSSEDVFVALDSETETVLVEPFIANWFPFQPVQVYAPIYQLEDKAQDKKVKLGAWLDPASKPQTVKQMGVFYCLWQEEIQKQIDAGKCGFQTGKPDDLDEDVKKCRGDYVKKFAEEICWKEYFKPDPMDATKPDLTTGRLLCPECPISGVYPFLIPNIIVVGHVPDVSAGGPVVQKGCAMALCRTVNSSIAGTVTGWRGKGEFCYKSVKVCLSNGDPVFPDEETKNDAVNEQKAKKALCVAAWDAWVADNPDVFPEKCCEPSFTAPDLKDEG